MGCQLSHFKMKFSIIIPARNEEAYLAKTLKSIEDQDYPDYETIVVANACTDNTHQIAKKYADKTILTKKPGVSHARVDIDNRLCLAVDVVGVALAVAVVVQPGESEAALAAVGIAGILDRRGRQ